MNFMQRLMYGRYGGDQFSVFLIALYLLLYLLSSLLHSSILSLLSTLVAAWCIYRMFSRRIDRRRAENAKFMTVAGPAIRWFKLRRTIHRDKEHRYFKCPNCGQQLRVPRGKGKITINSRRALRRVPDHSAQRRLSHCRGSGRAAFSLYSVLLQFLDKIFTKSLSSVIITALAALRRL